MKLTDQELFDKENWIRKHKQVCASPIIGISQHRESGIGVSTEVECLRCNKSKDITDVEVW